ncbi:MAG: ATP-binding cassette, subfamily B, bacterial MsbA [Parcubacteria group bacterium Greene0714_21]|nr:MAG: ATP-binding cassette, subfamily B, bacterial MsbA [Parcubacteria group bacterium Greene0416_39]TSC97771.1 MAG: ATP-binding cassette, subfamily B, bacterial MsbA [Parcubacteria group bacterium Greene1014_47]TSD04245.1 MAG: ATP-binding cassette, subfamily B, bacterial MsbA [Parcubacteria group bacterium Greene0714_21]
MEGVKIIFSYLKPYRKTVLLLSVLSIVSALTNAAVPYLTGILIDSLIALKTTFFVLLGAWLAVKLVSDFIDWRIGIKNDTLETIIEADYIVKGFSKILEFPLKFYKTYKTGDVTDRISRASGHISHIISRVIIDLAPQFLSIVFALAIIFSIQMRLGFIMVGGILLYVLVIWKISPALVKLYEKMYQTYHQAWGDAYDAVGNISAVKQATAEKFEQEKLYQNFKVKAAPLWTGIVTIWQQLSFWQKATITFIQLLIFFYSYSLVGAGLLTIGQLVAINAYASMIFGPFVVLARNWHTLQNGLESLKTAEQILSYPKEQYTPPNVVFLNTIQGEVVFKNVSFQYETTEPFVLKNINFTVEPGKKIALVGKSGEGKSTLGDLISLYERPTTGEIFIDGHNIKRLGLKQLRSQIGVVPQEVILFNDTIKNNIRYGRFEATQKEVHEASLLAHADEFIQKFPKKYNQVVGERGVKLSVGQKQRVAIARAILKNPRILILDEPTSALDARLETLLQESLNKLMEGRTTFVIAHRLSTVKSVDRILVLEGGSIAETGTHKELMEKNGGIYRNLYELQFGEIT